MDELDMLSTKEVNEISKSVIQMTKEIKMSGEEMKKALDMTGLNTSVAQYAKTLENDVSKQFDSMFGKQQKLLSIEERRTRLIAEMGKAMRSGNKEQEQSLKSLMKNFEQVQHIKSELGGSSNKMSGMDKAQGALNLAQGVIPQLSGASRVLNMGKGAMSFMGNGGGGVGTALKYGAPLAAAGYAASRMMGGYQTYKSQASDVLEGYGKFGREGYSRLDNQGSSQGYSSLDRARLSNQLSDGVRQGAVGADAGSVVSRNIGNVESLSRSFGLGTSAVGGMVNQVQQIQGGDGGGKTAKMMAEAVASGVNRARVSGFMEKSLHLTEQVYQGSGKKGSGINAMLARIIGGSKDKEYASRYSAQAVGQIGESIKAVGMGGGDLATQGFLSRAFKGKDGKQLSMFKQMERAQEGGSSRNIEAVMGQLDSEFENDDQRKMVMSQMFGTNFKQAGTLMDGMRNGDIKGEDIKKEIDRMKEENFIEKSPEGKLFKSIADATSAQALIGKEMLPLATEMVKLQTSMDKGILKIARFVNSIMGFFGIKDEFEEQKKKDIALTGKTGNAEIDFQMAAKYGGSKEKAALKSMQALEFGGDDKKASMSDLNNVDGFGLSMLSKIKGKKKNFGKILDGESPLQATMRESDDKDQIGMMKNKIQDYAGNLKEQYNAPETTTEMQSKITEMLTKLADAATKMGVSVDTYIAASPMEEETKNKNFVDKLFGMNQANVSSQMTFNAQVGGAN